MDLADSLDENLGPPHVVLVPGGWSCAVNGEQGRGSAHLAGSRIFCIFEGAWLAYR